MACETLDERLVRWFRLHWIVVHLAGEWRCDTDVRLIPQTEQARWELFLFLLQTGIKVTVMLTSDNNRITLV
jgi:hypothetical protein